MSSRRVLVVALLGAAAYCSLDPEAPAPPAPPAVVRRPTPAESPTGITPMPPTLAAVTAPSAPPSAAPSATPAPSAPPVASTPPRPAPEATGRIEPLLAAPQIVHETKPASPYAVVTEPSRAAWFPMPAESAPPIREAVAPQPPAFYPPPPPMYPYGPPPYAPAESTEALNRLIETTQELESRVQRLDSRLARRPEPRPAPRLEAEPQGPRLETVVGAPPLPRRRPEPDSTKGFDLAVKLIRRLMARIDRIEENLDIQEEPEPEDRDLRDPSATGLWRYAPPVR